MDQQSARDSATEAYFREIVEAIEDYAIYLLDPKGEISTWNAGARRIKGYEAREVLGRHYSMFFPRDAVERNEPQWALNVASAEGRYAHEGWRLRKDGERFWADVVITALRSPDGSLRGFAKVVRDVTRRRGEEERFRMALEAAPNAMVMVDQEGRIVLVNRQTETLFGYPRDQMLGRSIETLVPERFRARHPGYRHGFMSEPKARPMGAGRDLFGLRADGSEVPVEIGLNPLETAQGRFVLASIVDISERKRAENEIKHANADLERRVAERTAELKRSVEELERFTYTVAHDLRAPLRAVHRYAEMLEARGEAPKGAGDPLPQIMAGAKKMDRLIEDLLAYSKIGRGEARLESLDPIALAREAAASIRPLIEQSGAELVLPDGRGPRAQADRVLLSQVLSNFISNAIKFVPPGRKPRVGVGVERFDGKVRIWVQDNGIGIEPEYRDRIFKVFERLHAGEGYAGTGIGLAIVARAVERMGGCADFSSVPGEGTRFWVDLLAGEAS